MSRKKEERFEAIKTMDNVFEMDVFGDNELDHLFFEDDHPVVMELGCGKGDYVIQLAREYPEKNFIGVDIKGDRIYIGAKKALDEGLTNVVFLRTFVQFLKKHIDKESVSEIWITFPDPYHSDTKSRKRLTSSFFLDIYRFILKKGGIIHFKTDDDNLYQFTLDTLKKANARTLFSTEDLYREDNLSEKMAIKTTYEKRHMAEGKKIKYVRFQLK